MTLYYFIRSATEILLLAAIPGCADAHRTPSTDEAMVLVATDTLITTESELVGDVFDLTVAPNGDVYIADRHAPRARRE